MSAQPSLFPHELPPDICRRKHGGNHFSNQANIAAEPRKAPDKRRIYEMVDAMGRLGATCEEVSKHLIIRYTTASARISELKKRKRLFESGRERKTETGVMAAVLVTENYL